MCIFLFNDILFDFEKVKVYWSEIDGVDYYNPGDQEDLNTGIASVMRAYIINGYTYTTIRLLPERIGLDLDACRGDEPNYTIMLD